MSELELYFTIFNEYPIKIKTISYDDEMYKKLITIAILKNKPITNEDIENYIEANKLGYDTIENE